jgi:hypothetical protein
MKRLRVGVTISGTITDPIQACWASGVHQNAVYLCQLLSALPEVEWAGLVSQPATAGPHPLAALFGLNSAPLEQALSTLDIVVELGLRAGAPLMDAYRKAGGRLVSYVAGNAMVMNLEAVANKTPYGEMLNHAGYDAVWVTPQHWRTNHAYMSVTRTPRTVIAPHIWHPCVLERLSAHFGAPPAPEPAMPWRLGVFDPTVNVVKTFHIPLLVCEEAYRTRPDLVGPVLLFGALRLKPNIHFQEFCGMLDLAPAGRIFAEDRHPFAQVMGRHIDAVVTHQWENDLNYLYWDTLHLGYPLIHNSAPIKGAGYYFPDFDTRTGGAVLTEALAGHAANQDAYKKTARDAVWDYRIDNPAVRRRTAELLEHAMDSPT